MKLEKPKQVLAGLGILMVVVFAVQFVVLNSLENTGDKEKPTEKTITNNSEKWNESWKAASTASTDEELAKAEELLSKSLKEAERSGSKDSRLAAVLNCLAQVYEKQGKYSEAEPLYQRVLAIDEKVLGKDHGAIINDLDNLAVTYIKQKKYKEAEELFTKAVALDEKTYGKDHPKTAADLSYLVLLYDIEGNPKKAEEYARRALSINEKAFGADHPLVASNYHSLALLSSRQGKHEEAEKLLIKAQDIWRKTSAINDPKLAASLKNTAMLQKVFEAQFIEGEPDKSVKFPEAAFEKSKELRAAKQFKEAEEVLKDNLADARKSAVGTPALGKYLVRLNNVLFDQAKDGEAIIFGEIACKIFDRQPADKQADLTNWNASVHSYLAMAYDRRNHLHMAEKHYDRALDYASRASDVSVAWKNLLKKGQATCKARLEMEEERVLATSAGAK